MYVIILAALAAVTTAMPSYIAVPADQIAFVDLSALRVRRVPRQTLSPPPQLPHALYEQDYQPVPVHVSLPQYQQQTVALSAPPAPEAPARLVHAPQQEASGTQGASARYSERPPDFGEYVDFGAHTGDNGAFGWYADFPVNNHEDSGYGK